MKFYKKYENLLIPILLLISVIIYLIRAIKFYSISTAPDVITAYLPLSKIFLDQGVPFFYNIDSITVSPMAYIWGALFGAELDVIKTANLFLGIPVLLMIYRIGRLTYGISAGVISAYLFAFNPFLIPWFPTALGEPPFYFFTITWLWAMSEAFSRRGVRWLPIGISALGLSLSILTRGVWLYPSLCMLLAIGIASKFKFFDQSKVKISLCITCFAMILPASYILKNLIVFSVPVIDLGSGGALYYGTHLMTNGFEPPLLGLSYEDGGLLHTVEGSKLHLKVAKDFLMERDFEELVSWYLRKISWFTLFTGADVSVKHTFFRVLEISFAAIALRWCWRKKNIFLTILFLYLILQLLQSAFALYNLRYSTDSFELVLILISGIGLTVAISAIGSILNARFVDNSALIDAALDIGTLTLAFIGLSVFAFTTRVEPLIQLPKKMPTQILFSSANLNWHNISDDKRYGYELAVDVPAQDLPKNVLNGLWRYNLKLSAARPPADCKKMTVSYKEEGALTMPKPTYVNIINDGQNHQYLLGTRYENDSLFPAKRGVLLLRVECDQDFELISSELAFIAPLFQETYLGR